MTRLLREHRATVLVAVLASTFGVFLLHIAGLIVAAVSADEVLGSSATVALMLRMLASVFIVLAVYISAVVTSNTVSTVVAGRTRTIALMRLIGASATSQRASIAREGLVVGAIGAAGGIVLGSMGAWFTALYAVAVNWVPSVSYNYAEPLVLVPAGAVVLTTWFAAWIGARRVLGVRPIEALGAATERDHAALQLSLGRKIWATLLIVGGAALLALGIVVGLTDAQGVLIGVAGGVTSFTGVVLAAPLIMPRVLRLIGRMLGSSPSARLAAENAVRNPERSTRMTIGLVIGVTLVTMFAVTMQTVRTMMLAEVGASEMAGFDEVMNAVTGIFTVLIGFSALIAAVGLVNVLSLSVVQRTRELGLLRALGFERRQLRGMIFAESAALTAAATVTGLVLGFVYGWAGAQAMLGSAQSEPALVLPSVPWAIIVGIVVTAGALALIASITPTQRAMRVSPVEALAVA